MSKPGPHEGALQAPVHDQPMRRGAKLRALIRDLRRRHVFRVTGAYIVVAWIAFEVASETVPHTGLPQWTPLLVLLLAILGVPLAIVLAWAYDITPDGEAPTRDDPERFRRVQRVLAVALDLPDSERIAYVRSATGSDIALRDDVMSLLDAHARHGPLDRPAAHWLDSPAGRLPVAPAAGHLVGHYEILQELGDGGMGIVYRARDRRLQRVVALKFLPPHLSRDAEAKQRMLAEARAAAALDHPHVCTLLEIGEVDEQVFLAMPCYDGETLKQRLARGRLPLAEALDFAVQAASGLTAAHAKGIIHRDIKPANLIITSDGVLKILDFGIAKLADVAATMPGQTPGTVAYMSPEQARGGPIDARTDVWSLGIVLYESIAGRRPFGDTAGIPASSTQQEPEPLSAWRNDAPAAVDIVLRRALARDPAQRYRSGAEFHAALNGLLAGLSGSRDMASATRIDVDDAVHTELPPEGERRQATVVVSTIGGFAALVESAAHEQVRAALSRVRSAAEELADRFGGRLNSFDDDRIELLFGVPVSHEDHCFRGIRAVLELHERVRAIEVSGAPTQRPLTLHSGVDTGHVLAQPGADGLRLRLIGDPVRAAARLQAHAGDDELWITPACHRVVGAFFETAAREPLALGGGAFARPYRVLRLSGMNTRIEAGRLIGLTRYVGREVELAHLGDAVAKARAGRGQALTIHGEAGVGKSRLLHEFRQSLDATDVTFLEGRCQSFGGGIAYLPFIDVLREAVAAECGEHGERALAVAEAVRAISPELEGFIPLYLHLLSLPHDQHPMPVHLHGEALRHAMQEALAALVTLLARARPVVLLLEDWHWADDASGAVLRQILEMGAGHALLVVVTSRSQAAHIADLSRLTVLPLEPLGPDAGADMLRTVLGAREVSADLAERIHGRTGGNPFFIEEVGRALIEEGALRVDNGVATPVGDVSGLHLPDTVEAVIRGRLDRLDRDTREIARLASAVGREFERRLLEQAMHSGSRLPHALQTLKSAGLVQQIRVVPDAAYRFNHALTQEVAYSSLLERQRVDVHGRVAEAIERVYADKLEEHYARLADHFGHARSWTRAVHYGRRAADRLMGLSAFTDALDQLERCEEWIANGGGDDSTLIEVLLGQERSCETLGLRARQQQLIDRLIVLLENSDDRRLLAETYIRQGDLFTLLRRFDDAERVLLESLRLRRELNDPYAVRNALRSLGLLRWHSDRPIEAIAFIEETLEIDRQHDDADALVGDLSNLGAVLKSMGDHNRARAVLEEALAIIENGPSAVKGGGSSLKECYILHNLANVHRQLGEVDVATMYLQRATHLMELDQLPIQNSYHFTSLAHLCLQQGRIEESLSFYRQAVETCRRARYTPGLSQALRMLGDVLLGVGRENEALPCLIEAAGLFAQLEDTTSEARLWCQIAGVHDRCGAASQALDAWRRVAALVDGTADVDSALKAQVGIALAGRRAGLPAAEVRANHRAALESAIAAGARGEQGQLLNNLGIIAWEHADYAEALECYEAGLALYRRLDDPAGIGLMLNSLAATLKAMRRHDEVRVYIDEALHVHRRSGNRLLEAHAFALLGDVALEVGDADRALESFTESLALRGAVRDRPGEGWMHIRIASAYAVMGRPERVVEHTAAARRIAEECADGELIAACEQLLLSAHSA